MAPPLTYMPEGSDIETLLEQLRVPVPQRAKPGVGQQIGRGIGGIGDALMAAAAVKAGGAPPQMGANMRRQLLQEQQHLAKVEAATAENRATERMIRVSERQHQQDLAKERVKAGLKPPGNVHSRLIPVRITGEDARRLGVPDGTTGYREAIRQPGPLSEGGGKWKLGDIIDTAPDPSARLVKAIGKPYMLLNPKTGLTEVLYDTASGEPLYPEAAAADIEMKSNLETMAATLDDVTNLAIEYTNEAGTEGGALFQQFIRENLGMTGVALSEMYGSPTFEKLAASRERLGVQLARLVERGRLSDQDVERALRQLGTIPSLRTESGQEAYKAKAARVHRELLTRINEYVRMKPGMFAGQKSRFSENEQLFRNKILPMSAFEEMEKKVREREMGRFLDGGGFIIEGE